MVCGAGGLPGAVPLLRRPILLRGICPPDVPGIRMAHVRHFHRGVRQYPDLFHCRHILRPTRGPHCAQVDDDRGIHSDRHRVLRSDPCRDAGRPVSVVRHPVRRRPCMSRDGCLRRGDRQMVYPETRGRAGTVLHGHRGRHHGHGPGRRVYRQHLRLADRICVLRGRDSGARDPHLPGAHGKDDSRGERSLSGRRTACARGAAPRSGP